MGIHTEALFAFYPINVIKAKIADFPLLLLDEHISGSQQATNGH
jgi:hypothetical protein